MVEPIFDTERLVLRPLVAEDARMFFSAVDADRGHLRQWLPWVDGMDSEARAEQMIEAALLQLEMDHGGLWGIFERSGVFLGTVSVQWIQWDHLAASLGYWLFSRHQGCGYAAEACRRILEYCFAERRLNRVELSVAAQNQRSLALVRRLGFALEGYRRQYERLHGRFWDHYSYALLALDWERGSLRQ